MTQTRVQLVGNVSAGASFSGIVTATSFSGDGSGLTGVGIGSTGSVNTTGIITASKISANEFEGIGDKLIFSPIITSFNPIDGATNVSALSSPNIVLTYNQPVSIGTTGTITLRTNSASGTIVESFSVGVSTRVTISNQTLAIDPTNNFDYNQEYYVVVPQGSVTNYVGGNAKLLDTYNFTTEAGPIVTLFNPADEATNVGISSNIVVTFDKNIRAGVGTITLRTDSAVGSIVESYDVTSSNRLTFSTNTLTIDPTSNLSYGTVYYVVIPNNAVAGYSGTDTYNFTAEAGPTLSSVTPADEATSVGITTNIVFTFNKNILAGVGTITLRTDSASGTIVESYDVSSSGRLTFNSNILTIDPTSDLSYGTVYYVVIPNNAVAGYSGTDTYNFTTVNPIYNLFAWGTGGNGQLGQSNTTEYSSPVQIPGTTWSSISGGVDSNYSLATKTDGTLWSWGSNSYGILGQSDATPRSSPRQIPGNTWSSISAGSQHSLAKKTDNTLWAWGRNPQGQLGQNNRTSYSSPVQIPGTTWSSISAGSHSLAIKTDGTLWSWGYNGNGQLGQSNTTYRSSPVQIPGTTWTSAVAGSNHSLATKTDGTLWSWGNNGVGRLGQSDTTPRSSPVQIPGTTWSSISAGSNHS